MKKAIAALLAAGLLVATIQAQGVGIRLYLDGQPVGTLAGSGLQYRLAEGEIWIETAEGVFGCELDRIFWDRFDGQD
jgi:hypothetical protein